MGESTQKKVVQGTPLPTDQMFSVSEGYRIGEKSKFGTTKTPKTWIPKLK